LGVETQRLFCPYDGRDLTDSKWAWCGRRLLVCPDGHVWEVFHNPAWKNSIEFTPMQMVRCRCEQIAPARLMKEPQGTSVKTPPLCPACYEVIKKAWRPDLKASYAHLIISPIRQGKDLYFKYEQRAKIEPYPNPYGAGGWWGGGAVKTKAEMETVVLSFKGCTQRWKDLGVKIEIIRQPEMTATEQANERIIAQVEERSETKPQLRLLC